jgi:hypothetical protein
MLFFLHCACIFKNVPGQFLRLWVQNTGALVASAFMFSAATRSVGGTTHPPEANSGFRLVGTISSLKSIQCRLIRVTGIWYLERVKPR